MIWFESCCDLSLEGVRVPDYPNTRPENSTTRATRNPIFMNFELPDDTRNPKYIFRVPAGSIFSTFSAQKKVNFFEIQFFLST